MIRRPSLVTALLVLLGLTLPPGFGQAAPIVDGSGLPAPAVTITFAEAAFSPGTTITNEFSGPGVTFSPYLIYQSPTSCCDGMVGEHLGNTGSTTVGLANPFSIKFTAPQSAAAFGLATETTTTLFEALLAGVAVPNTFFFSGTSDEYNQPGQPIGPFFGFSGIQFDEIRVTVGVSTLQDQPGSLRALIDNIQLGQGPASTVSAPPIPTPEPATLLLFGMTAGGLAVVRRSRRRRNQQQ